jgi:hypothetical protein
MVESITHVEFDVISFAFPRISFIRVTNTNGRFFGVEVLGLYAW